MTSIRPTDPAAAVPDAAGASEQRAREAAGVFARAGTALRHCLDEVHAADDAAWSAYSDAAEAAIAHLQAELILAGARLDAERALDHDQIGEAATTASHLARQRLEELRVQAHLGAMDAVMAAESTVSELEHVAADVRQRAQRIQHRAAGSVDEVRRRAGDAIHGAGRALMVMAAAARSGDDAFEEKRPT